ncbi:hypothetical protein [Mangrovihabitans endophyticus]|uniref:Uncharacterized protein n=1 Tax=Mangrovihabitans endophyticus TaxID=1751298 RepID=A0A8J3FPT9_9ACTN|nr:hypothetical protein [Mangrovihabitans endophyticus]GGL01922.1 hypothetical protein GCM10012284_40590 [Mangrovihabitans endophyticus]
MSSLNQFAFVSGTTNYEFGHNSIPNIPITGSPADANIDRVAMLHDGSAYRFYAFQGSTSTKLYQYSFDGSSYAFGHNSIPELTLEGFPSDVDASSFEMLHDGSNYRLYMRRLGDRTTLYQAAFVAGTTTYRFGHNSIPQIQITGFPADTDWSRWGMLHDGEFYRFYAFKLGSNTEFYQGAFDGSTYAFGHKSIPTLTLVGTPANSDLHDMSMLHDGSDYRLYLTVR